MLHGSPHPGVAGSELTRLLAHLRHPAHSAYSAAAPPVLAERLGHWLGWTGAIALASALHGATEAAASRPTTSGHEADRAAADFLRVRAALAASLAAGPREPVPSPNDFGPYRRFCAAQQQAMKEAVAALRQRLRQALVRRSPALARVAAVDAVMADALAEREHTLLGLVPLRLQAHFEHLQGSTGAAAATWPQAFAADLHALLQAELAHRLLPAQGLLDTLQEAPHSS